MKFNDYRRLGKISVKSRKKSTRTTVRGIAFGLTMIIPVLFLTLSLKLDINSIINETKSILSTVVTTNKTNETINIINEGNNIEIPSITARDEILKNNKDLIETSISATYLDIDPYYNIRVSIDDDETDVSEAFKEMKNNYNFNNSSIKIIPDDAKLMPDSYQDDLDKINGSFFKYGEGFSSNSKGEILISEKFASLFTQSPEELIGKKFDLRLSTNNSPFDFRLDNDNNPNNTYDEYANSSLSAKIFDDFTIKGIISKDYYDLSDITSIDAFLWITESSFNNGKYIPEFRKHTFEKGDFIEEFIVVTYVKDAMVLEEKAKQDKSIFIAYPLVKYVSPFNYYYSKLLTSPLYSTLIQCKEYAATDTLNNTIDSYLKVITKNKLSYFPFHYATTGFENFQRLNSTSKSLILCLSIFGGIIFFATLLNLYNSINYSVEARHNYLAMMRAIGAKNNVIPRLYLMEILIIFFKALPWAIVFSAGISYGIKDIVDRIFRYGSSLLSATVELSFVYYFVALAVVLVIVLLIGLLFSYIACLSVTRKHILDIFDEDK